MTPTTREETMRKLKAALIAVFLDVAEDLSADHVDEVIDPDASDEARAKEADALTFDTIHASVIEIVTEVGNSGSLESLREKFPRLPFV